MLVVLSLGGRLFGLIPSRCPIIVRVIQWMIHDLTITVNELHTIRRWFNFPADVHNLVALATDFNVTIFIFINVDVVVIITVIVAGQLYIALQSQVLRQRKTKAG